MIRTIKYFVENNPNEINNDLIASWNEVNEVLTDLEELTIGEIIECLPCIKVRLQDAQNWLSKYVSDEDVIKEIL
jgi:hypothetical protein